MARKSRKDMEQQRIKPYHAIMFRVAMYIRLSVEDKKKRGNSIESQRSIIENHIALNPDFKLFDVYIDNGTTGTTFERDEFQRMLADIEAGKINCVIVKDISRIGRNFLDTGDWLQQLKDNGIVFIETTLSQKDNFLRNKGRFQKFMEGGATNGRKDNPNRKIRRTAFRG